MKLNVYDNTDELASGASTRIAELIAAAPDHFSLGIAGGSTPRATYRILRQADPGWNKVTSWMSDERWVTPDHPRCNGAMAARVLFDHVPAKFVRPVLGGPLSAPESAAAYDMMLRTLHEKRPPDLIMLGMGDDGHTASLFPGTLALGERDRWYVANDVPQVDEERLTATYPLLWSANILMVLVAGAGKARALAEALQGRMPAGKLGEGHAEVEWYADREAASRLG